MNITTDIWDPRSYSSKHLILIVGDMDLSFCRFLLPFLQPSTIVLNTSYLSKNEILSSRCASDFEKNKQKILNKTSNVSIYHSVDVNNIASRIEFKSNQRFDCVIFLFPQATGASDLLRSHKYTEYNRLNAHLIKEYIIQATKIISEYGQVDFVIKQIHIKQWLEKLSSRFTNSWISYYNITGFIFDVASCSPYTPRHEKGYSFDPGRSVLISSSIKSSNLNSIAREDKQGLNIEFEHSGQLLTGNFGFGDYDARRDYKQIRVKRESGRNIYYNCRALASARSILFANCIATIRGELFETGQHIECKKIFTRSCLKEWDMIKNNQFSNLVISTRSRDTTRTMQ